MEFSENKNDTLPDKNENYKDVQYWDQRYTTEESYEWCKDFNAIKSHIEKHIKSTDKILVIGMRWVLSFVYPSFDY